MPRTGAGNESISRLFSVGNKRIESGATLHRKDIWPPKQKAARNVKLIHIGYDAVVIIRRYDLKRIDKNTNQKDSRQKSNPQYIPETFRSCIFH